MQDPNEGSGQSYSTREVAALFGVNVDTVQRWSRAGKLTRLDWVSNGYRYSVEAVDEALQDPGGEDN